MDYTSDIESAFEDHPEQVNELVKNMKEGSEKEALQVLEAEISTFHHTLMTVIQESRELTDFQKTLADSILGYVQDNEYNQKELQRLSNHWLLSNYPEGLEST